ncbi:unnamed protein product [Linum trigynum]|uniref:NAB domain-containing protein n=1 Tax=Linum trigynum TaxID=586398 RepID=A0AAV2EXG3_9ROSI
MAIVDDDEDMMRKDSSHKWWWIDSSHSASPRSPWLHSTLSELNRKTKAMMKLIETEADSFAQRAEMYYKKRPELINMVQDSYKAQRSLLEQFDQLQSENRTRLPRLSLSPTSSSVSDHYYDRGGKRSTTMSLSSDDDHHEPFDCKSTISSGMGDGDQDQIQTYDRCRQSTSSSHSELFHDGVVVEDSDSGAESEVDDPVVEDEAISANTGFAAQVENVEKEYDEVVKKLKEEVEQVKEENRLLKEQLWQKDEEKREVIRQLSSANVEREYDEVEKKLNLKAEVEELKEENRLQKEQLSQKDEEKREVIRQLSSAMEILRLENAEARKLKKKKKKQQNDMAEERSSEKRSHHRVSSELEKLKDSIFTKLFQGSPISKGRVTVL